MLKQLDVHLTHRCTLRCSYCYTSVGCQSLPGDLTEECADRCVDFLFENGRPGRELRLCLWGGEPLLRFDLVERITRRASKRSKSDGRRVRVTLPTNGTELSSKMRKELERLGVSYSLSLDGAPEAYEQRPTPGGRCGWELIGPNVEALVAETPPGGLPPVRMTVAPGQAHRFFEDVGFLLGLGFRKISFMPASGQGWTRAQTEALDRGLEALADLFCERLGGGQAPLPVFPTLSRRLTAAWQAESSGPIRRFATCGAGHELLAADTAGDLYPCHRFVGAARPADELRLGNVRNGILDEELRERFAAFGPDDPRARCVACAHRDGCGYVCVALNHVETGDPFCVTEATCFANERLGRAAAHMHQKAKGSAAYERYIRRIMREDPDERMLPLAAALDSDMDGILERVEEILD